MGMGRRRRQLVSSPLTTDWSGQWRLRVPAPFRPAPAARWRKTPCDGEVRGRHIWRENRDVRLPEKCGNRALRTRSLCSSNVRSSSMMASGERRSGSRGVEPSGHWRCVAPKSRRGSNWSTVSGTVMPCRRRSSSRCRSHCRNSSNSLISRCSSSSLVPSRSGLSAPESAGALRGYQRQSRAWVSPDVSSSAMSAVNANTCVEFKPATPGFFVGRYHTQIRREWIMRTPSAPGSGQLPHGLVSLHL